MSCDLKLADLLELSKVYAPEYNMPELHDRVLVFDVMQDGWETDAILTNAEHNDDSVNEDGSVEDISLKTSNEQQQEVNNESNSEGESSVAVEANIKIENTSGQDSGTSLNSEASNLIAADENQLDQASTISSQNPEVSKKGILRQHKIFVHSSWLAVQSKYFRSLFCSGMKESSIKEVHVKVSECEEATHLMLLEAIYKADILNDAAVEELLAVLELADKYDVKFVFKKCKYVLQTRVQTLDICKQVMHVIKEKHSFEDVEDLATTMQVTMGQNFTPLENHWQTEKFTSQTQPFVEYLLASSQLQTCCENTVFQALMHWMEVNNVDPASLDKDSRLLKSVRFEAITIDYLYNVVRVHTIASKMPGFQDLMLQGMTYHALSPELKQLHSSEITPRQRQINTGIAQYTWTISRAQLMNYKTTPINSEKFWLCGYKAYIHLQYNSAYRGGNSYSVQVYVHLLELTNKSYVPLTWTVSGQCFSAVSANYNFSSTSSSSVQNITFNTTSVWSTTSLTITVNKM